MSNHHILAEISRHLRNVLWLGIEADDATRALVQRESAIRINAPNSTDADARLFLWLYEVRLNRYLANSPAARPQRGIAAPLPLLLDLHYVITPSPLLASQDGADLVLLARVIQIMAAVPHIAILAENEQGEMRLTQVEPDMAEQIALWSALRQPFQLSAFYQIGVAHIDPLSFDHA